MNATNLFPTALQFREFVSKNGLDKNPQTILNFNLGTLVKFTMGQDGIESTVTVYANPEYMTATVSSPSFTFDFNVKIYLPLKADGSVQWHVWSDRNNSPSYVGSAHALQADDVSDLMIGAVRNIMRNYKELA